jgi:uncharacterized protein
MTVSKTSIHWQRRLGSLARWLHIYISMLSCVLVLFFAITGLTLNHADWFGATPHQRDTKGQCPVGWVKTDDTRIARLEIVEHLRSRHGVKGAMSEFRIEEDQCAVSFKGPAYSADAYISRASGEYDLTEMRMGLVAIINDLHKGRDTGPAWSWFIDVSSVLLALVSLTGLLLMAWIKRHRFNGYVVAALGGIACWLLYLFAVP